MCAHALASKVGKTRHTPLRRRLCGANQTGGVCSSRPGQCDSPPSWAEVGQRGLRSGPGVRVVAEPPAIAVWSEIGTDPRPWTALGTASACWGADPPAIGCTLQLTTTLSNEQMQARRGGAISGGGKHWAAKRGVTTALPGEGQCDAAILKDSGVKCQTSGKLSVGWDGVECGHRAAFPLPFQRGRPFSPKQRHCVNSTLFHPPGMSRTPGSTRGVRPPCGGLKF